MKKTFSLVIIGVILGSTVALAGSKVFSDIPTDAWYASAVSSLSEKGIIGGYPDGTFGGGNTVNRAEIAVMLDRTIQYIETGEVTEEAFASTCTPPTSPNLLTLQKKFVVVLDNVKYNYDEIDSKILKWMKPQYAAFEGDFFIKGIKGKIAENIYSSSIEFAPTTDTPEYFFADVVWEAPSYSNHSSLFKNNENKRIVSFVQEECGQFEGVCMDHIAFPEQINLTIDDTAKSASLETVYPSADPNSPIVTTTNENYIESDTLYNCLKTDTKGISDKYGKTPSQW